MKKLFDMDNPLMRTLSTAADLLTLNILTLVLSLPLVTMGPAVIAMNDIVLRMVRSEETYIVKPYLRAFRDNFKQGALMSLLVLAAAALLYVDYVAAIATIPMLRIVSFAVAVIVYALFLYTFALLARFENSIRATLKNAAALSVGFFPRTLAMVVFAVGFWLGGFRFYRFGIPLLLMFGLSLPCYVKHLLLNSVFRKLEESAEGSE